ncbi:hypothetical protein [Streptomyces goshikiensis]|uniref:hypothetical protein n=1 Tax=Streptomyces goshikiensis TaxID=1942 RepID=UPI0033B039D9
MRHLPQAQAVAGASADQGAVFTVLLLHGVRGRPDGQVERVNELLHDWKVNGQPLPDGLPDKVVSFLTAGLAVPAWADQAAISRAQRFEQEHAIEEGIAAVHRGLPDDEGGR